MLSCRLVAIVVDYTLRIKKLNSEYYVRFVHNKKRTTLLKDSNLLHKSSAAIYDPIITYFLE